jgi:hypothetical protein
MEKIFGDKTRFAIECRINDNSGQHFFGNVCLWVSNRKIGVFERQALLTRVAYLFLQSVDNRHKRSDNELCGRSAISVFNKVFNAIYGELEDDISQKEIIEEGKHYSPFLLLAHWEDNFDDCVAVIVECEGKQRFIWKSWKEVEINTINEATLDAGQYEKVATAFVDWFTQEIGVKLSGG